MSWKLIVGILCMFTGVFTIFGIALILVHILDVRKKSKSVDSSNDWNSKTFINSSNMRDRYEQRYY